MHNRRRVISGPSVLPQTAALVAAMSTPPTAARKSLIDATIRSLIVSGVWAKCDLIYMLAAHDSQAARLNWKNPGTNTLTVVNSPTFATDRGYTGDGVSAVLEAAYTNVLLTQNDGHISCFGLTETTSGAADISATNSTPSSRAYVRVRSGTNALAAVGTSAGTTSPGSAVVPRLVAANRVDSANQSIYSNGVVETSTAQASSATVITKITFLGNGVAQFTNRQIAFGTVGASLSTVQHAALYAASQSYLQAVGAT